MNLHAIVSGAVSAVNPSALVTVRVSAGYTIAADGTQVPSYTTFSNVPAQIQALSYTDLMKMGGLNIEGIRRAIYLNGNIEGVDRAAIKGGDLITEPDGTVWLVAMVLEAWPDWSKVCCTKQVS